MQRRDVTMKSPDDSLSSDKGRERQFSLFSGNMENLPQDEQQQHQQKKSYDERLREVRDREAKERQRKLDQMLNSLQRAEELREKQDEERLKKRHELRMREDEHRQMVDVRRKKLEEDDSERKHARLKKYEELTRRIADFRAVPKLTSPVSFRRMVSDDGEGGEEAASVRPRPHSNPTRLPSYAAPIVRSGRSPQKAPVEKKTTTGRIVSASPELNRRALRTMERSRARHRNNSGKQVLSPTATNEFSSDSVMVSSMSRVGNNRAAVEKEVYVMSRSLEAAYLSSMFVDRPDRHRRYLPQTPSSSGSSRIARPIVLAGEAAKSARKSPRPPRESPKPSKLPTVVRARSAPAGVRFEETPSPPVSAMILMEAVRCGTRSQMSSPSMSRRVLRSKIPKVAPADHTDERHLVDNMGNGTPRNLVARSSSSTTTSPRPALRKSRHRRSNSSPGSAVRQVTFTPDVMAASMGAGDDEDEEAKEREYKRKLTERRQVERERRAEMTLAAEKKALEEAQRLSAEELKRQQEVAEKLNEEKKAEEERLMKMMEDEYKSKLEQMEKLEQKRQASRRAYEERIEKARHEYRQKQEEERLERRRKFELIKQRLKTDLAESKAQQPSETGVAGTVEGMEATTSDVIKLIYDPANKAPTSSGIPVFKSARLNQMLSHQQTQAQARRSPSSDEA